METGCKTESIRQQLLKVAGHLTSQDRRSNVESFFQIGCTFTAFGLRVVKAPQQNGSRYSLDQSIGTQGSDNCMEVASESELILAGSVVEILEDSENAGQHTAPNAVNIPA